MSTFVSTHTAQTLDVCTAIHRCTRSDTLPSSTLSYHAPVELERLLHIRHASGMGHVSKVWSRCQCETLYRIKEKDQGKEVEVEYKKRI